MEISSSRAFCLFGPYFAYGRTRKDFVADEVLQMVWGKVYKGKKKPVVGVYRLAMKSNGGNFRASVSGGNVPWVLFGAGADGHPEASDRRPLGIFPYRG